MELNEIRGKKGDDLEALEHKLRQEYRNLRLKLMVGNLADTTALRKIKKDIARVLTVKNEVIHEKH